MKINKKYIVLLITIIVGLSLLIGNATAVTTKNTKASDLKPISKKTSVYKWKISGKTFKNKYIKISLGKTYVNGRVYGTNPATGKVQKAPVYAQKAKISALSKKVKIKKIVIKSIGYPSWRYYTNTYSNKSNKWITPGKYKGFYLFTIYYAVNMD